MALFGRRHLPARSTLSRFLAALTKPATEALRSLFLDDLLARPLSNKREIGGLADRGGKEWIVFDIDGTREAARQRALPKTEDRPGPQRRLGEVCAPGYTGRKWGETVRTRSLMSMEYAFTGSLLLFSLLVPAFTTFSWESNMRRCTYKIM